jgi:hypothetical protein
MRRLVDPYTARLPIPDARHAGRGILSDRGENGQETTAAEEMPTQIGKARKRWRPGGRRLATSSRAITPLQIPGQQWIYAGVNAEVRNAVSRPGKRAQATAVPAWASRARPVTGVDR